MSISIDFAGFKRMRGDASNPTHGIVVDNASKALHIVDPSDVDTDWNVSADTHPSVYIHSATNPATEYLKMYHDATNAYIDGVGATALKLLVAGTAEVDITSSAVSPSTSNGAALGTTALMWSDLFLASGGVIDFNNGDVTLTHSSNQLALAGGNLFLGDAIQAIFGASSDVTVQWEAAGSLLFSAAADDTKIEIGDSAATQKSFDVYIYGNAANGADYILWNASDSQLEFVGGATIEIGTTGTPLALTAGTPIFDMYTTCASTSGSTSAESFFVSNVMTGPAGVGGRARFYMTANVALGGWANALKAHTVFGASGRVTGLGSAFCAELELSAGTTQGTYAPLESEVISNTGCSTGTATSFLYGNIGGTDTSVANTNGYLFELGTGVSDQSGGIFEAESNSDSLSMTHVLKCRIAGTTYYIPLNTSKGF